MGYDWKTELPGISSHHADTCPVRDGRECTCGPLGYRASVRDWETNQRSVSPVFESPHEAVDWQRDQMVSSTPLQVAAEPRGELGALIDEFLQAAEDGLARDETGAHYTRERVRVLRGALSYVDSELGTLSVQEVRRRHIQGLLDQLRGSGVPAGRVAGIVEALRALYAYAIRRDIVGFSPVVELELPEAAPDPAATAASNGSGPPPGEWTTSDVWTTPPPVGPQWTPPPSTGAYPTPPPAYLTPPPGYPTPPQPYPTPPQAYPTAPYGYPTWYPPPSQTPERTTGPLSTILGSPTAADADYDSTMQERWLWWTVRIIVIVFVLIALVLVAESV
jgi:hypothetical protein